MPDTIERLALLSVGRACGFAMLGILVMVLGLSGDPPMALRTGAALSLLACMTLILKAQLAGHKSYRTTELWLLLPPGDRPHEAIAQRIISLALREVFFRFALYFAYGAAAMLATDLAIAMLPAPPQ